MLACHHHHPLACQSGAGLGRATASGMTMVLGLAVATGLVATGLVALGLNVARGAGF